VELINNFRQWRKSDTIGWNHKPALHSSQWESSFIHLVHLVQTNWKSGQNCRLWLSLGSLIPDFASVNTAPAHFLYRDLTVLTNRFNVLTTLDQGNHRSVRAVRPHTTLLPFVLHTLKVTQLFFQNYFKCDFNCSLRIHSTRKSADDHSWGRIKYLFSRQPNCRTERFRTNRTLIREGLLQLLLLSLFQVSILYDRSKAKLEKTSLFWRILQLKGYPDKIFPVNVAHTIFKL
jgi:hypothetical protein